MNKTSSEYLNEFTSLVNKKLKLRVNLINKLVRLSDIYPNVITEFYINLNGKLNKSSFDEFTDVELCIVLRLYESHVLKKSRQTEIQF